LLKLVEFVLRGKTKKFYSLRIKDARSLNTTQSYFLAGSTGQGFLIYSLNTRKPKGVIKFVFEAQAAGPSKARA
jgi:hypothetical protein